MESPRTQHGLVSASVIGIGEHIYDGIGHRRDEEGDIVDYWDYFKAVVEVVHVTLSGMIHGPAGKSLYPSRGSAKRF